MRAVSNTSPISNLAIIGQLSLLKSQFSEVWNPQAVVRELQAHPNPAARAAIEQSIREKWIHAAGPTQSPLLHVLSPHLHIGEAEAIALAAHLKTDILVIDEQEGRKYATQAGLTVMGVLGVLLRAKKDGDIVAIKTQVQALRSKARLFISPALEAKIMKAAGE